MSPTTCAPSAEQVQRLIRVAELARRFFENAAAANGRNAPHDDILIGRDLTHVLQDIEREKE